MKSSQLYQPEGFAGESRVVIPPAVLDPMEGNSVRSALYITDIGFYPNARHHHLDRPSGVDQHILIYVIDGEGTINVADRSFVLRTNQYFVIPANESHGYFADEENPWSIYWAHFKGERALTYASHFGKVQSIAPAQAYRIEERIDLFREIIYCLGMGFSNENMDYANMCFHHLLATFIYDSQFSYFTQLSPHDLIEQIILYMKSNLHLRITLESLSEKFDISVSQLSKLFCQRTRQSPISYLIALKMQKACQLLDFTNLRIKAISTEVGFNDMYFFSRQFKKFMGVSPSEYRSRHVRAGSLR
jgi:AraC-like DNA-binding protein/mannose-6-phosphate isomerase-like protein (cupin superfamily)